MAVTLGTIEPHVRSLLGDYTIVGRDIFTYTSSNIFTLSESNVVTIEDTSVNDATSGVTYTFDSDRNKLTVTSALSVGDIVEVQYTMYNEYSSAEIQQYVKAAISHININRYSNFIVEDLADAGDLMILPEPVGREIHLIAIVTAILIKPDNRSYRLPDMTISLQSKELPTDQKISRVIGIFKKSEVGTFCII